MPADIVLINLTDQGAKDLKQVAARVRQMQNQGSHQGVKLLGWYLTMGAYDAVAIAEAPDDEAMVSGLLRVGTEGAIRTTTLRAFPLEELEQLVASAP